MTKAKGGLSTRKKIYEELKRQIFTCALSPSDVLIVDELAKHFGVSRTPVREALIALCNEGLLDARHRVGFIVTPVNAKEIVETYSLRILLEKEAVRLATPRLLPEDLRSLEAMSREPQALQNRHFHSLIAKASGWGVLLETLEMLMDKSARTRALFTRVQERMADAAIVRVYGHEQIYDAMASGKAEEAAYFMEMHLNEARERVLRIISMI